MDHVEKMPRLKMLRVDGTGVTGATRIELSKRRDIH
jgi:hypothetical protein